ncbi:MAG TPA: MBL fold metallo-hydrolase [Marinilabiliaceae bacterium]|nr:MBL fold metallo-hydrolase [Marinilabiliaceae bacterium]
MIDISIDMLSVGNADAIIVWLKDNSNNHYVVLIDGGNKSDGEKVINHLEKYVLGQGKSGKNAPDLIISTHHDKDHIGGLTEVVNHYGNAISEVWVNNPAHYMDKHAYGLIKESFRKQSEKKQYQVILESLNNLDEFITAVDNHGIVRNDALYGRSKHEGIIQILGPSEDFYKSLLPGMDGLEDFVTQEANWAYNSIYSEPTINESLEESSPCPIVDEENQTSATNNSSVILQILAREQNKYLFTGDAGVSAFEDVEDRFSLEGIHWLDVPHHGSRRNLSSRLIDTMSPNVCYISAKGGIKHPRRALVNCLKNHGAKVYCTKNGNNMWHHRGDFPERSEYSSMEPL